MTVDGFWIESLWNTTHRRVYLNPKYGGQQPFLRITGAKLSMMSLSEQWKMTLSGRSYCLHFISVIPQPPAAIEVPLERAWFSLKALVQSLTSGIKFIYGFVKSPFDIEILPRFRLCLRGTNDFHRNDRIRLQPIQFCIEYRLAYCSKTPATRRYSTSNSALWRHFSSIFRSALVQSQNFFCHCSSSTESDQTVVDTVWCALQNCGHDASIRCFKIAEKP